ncbi:MULTISPECIES: group II intron maturase-specific domain-containing protein [unclassified Wolbachia]|nr:MULTISPECIES: group II intron maturase-specific domain-containing protein [unclassified Wolbachia]MDV6249301.1 group II intron maturase-specific domain-containing protein [Wolbachia endosymbiont of Zaprionus taronus]WOE63429.1 group II intron maturase-specific domain-containing protein [Wolbachia endosymbiont of Zaprionus tsacasi]
MESFNPQNVVQFKEAPLLACVALHGLEQHVKKALTNELFQCMKRKYGRISHKNAQKSISVIFYCDDFVIIHENEEIILKAKILVEEWLETIGLKLKPSKTRISHTLRTIDETKPGFDFLGFSIRQYPTKESKKGYTLLIKPSRNSIKQHTFAIKHKLREMRGAPQEVIIRNLNPINRGWSQYYSSVVSCKIFSSLDNTIHRKLWKWAVFRHPNKGKCWIKRKYFKKYNNDNWRFMTSNKIHLIIHSDHVIKRHIKVQKTRSPYDGDWVYWGNRLREIPDKPSRVIKLLKLQQSKCGNCRLWFESDDIIEIHHKDRNRRSNMIKNLSLLHGHCHDELHRRCA